jgi:hypothetical protein
MMEKLVSEVKEQKYETKEYVLSDGSGAKAVECVPVSAVGGKERLVVTGLDDLSVSQFFSWS